MCERFCTRKCTRSLARKRTHRPTCARARHSSIKSSKSVLCARVCVCVCQSGAIECVCVRLLLFRRRRRQVCGAIIIIATLSKRSCHKGSIIINSNHFARLGAPKSTRASRSHRTRSSAAARANTLTQTRRRAPLCCGGVDDDYDHRVGLSYYRAVRCLLISVGATNKSHHSDEHKQTILANCLIRQPV